MNTNYGQYSKNIYIEENNPDFYNKIEKSILKIQERPVGKRLITKIENGLYPVRIEYDANKDVAIPDNGFCPIGYGCGTTIKVSLKSINVFGATEGDCFELPFEQVLVHELIHGYHIQNGKVYLGNRTDPSIWTTDEEYHTIMGFPSKNSERIKPKITQNAILRENGLLSRFSHYVFCTGQIQEKVQFHLKAQKVKTVAISILGLGPKSSFSPPPVVEKIYHVDHI